jgi:hypothetical protein
VSEWQQSQKTEKLKELKHITYKVLILDFNSVEHAEIETSDVDWEYEEIPIEEFEEISESDGEESLEKAVKNISEKAFFGGITDRV